MSAAIAYAVSILLNLGVISSNQVNQTMDDIKVIQRDGKTIIVDSIGTELIIVG